MCKLNSRNERFPDNSLAKSVQIQSLNWHEKSGQKKKQRKKDRQTDRTNWRKKVCKKKSVHAHASTPTTITIDTMRPEFIMYINMICNAKEEEEQE